MRDFTKDLTILVAGSGNVTMPHLEQSLGEWIFLDEKTEREVHVILPLLAQMGAGIRNLIDLGLRWDFKFTVIQAKDAPMTRALSALPEESFVRADHEREALELGFRMLTDEYKELGNEAAFMMAYNPKNTYEQGNHALSDFEIIGDAKNYAWLQTLNLCDSLLDSFEGYESTDEILKRERLQKEFAEKQKAEDATKPVTEKAPVPRKRAVKKAVAPKVTKPVEVHQEAVQTSSGPNPHRAPIPGNPVHDDPRNELSASVPLVIGTPDIQEDMREAHAKVEKRSMLAVSRDDLAQLSTDIKELTTAFGNIMDTFTRILKDS